MPELNPLSNEQIFLKKIAENTGSDYNTGDVSEINPITIDQILLKEIAANTEGQSGDITELEGKVADNTSAIEATQDMISDAYDSTHTYNVGDYCIYENALYKCNTASTTGTWDSSKWDAVNTTDEIASNTDNIGTLTSLNTTAKNNLVSAINEVFGKFVRLDFYRVTGNEFDSSVVPDAHAYIAILTDGYLTVGYKGSSVYDVQIRISYYSTDISIRYKNDGQTGGNWSAWVNK